MHLRLVLVCLFLTGCGCMSFDELMRADQDAELHNRHARDAALARAGLTYVQPRIDMDAQVLGVESGGVNRPTVITAPEGSLGKNLLLLPTGTIVGRDASGKFHDVVVEHTVASRRSHRVCGCGPGARGTMAVPPIPYVVLDDIYGYGGAVHVMVPDWIEIELTHPEANDRHCFQIP